MQESFFIPQWDKLLIKPDENLKKIGSILLPDNMLQKRRVGTVISAGGGKTKDEPVYISAGEHVLFNLNKGTEIEIDGVDYLLMSQEDVHVVFDEKAELGFRVLGTRIFIEPDPVETEINLAGKFKLIKPGAAQVISRRGLVVKVGEKIKDEVLPLKPGDTVHFYGNAGSGLIDGSDFNLSADKQYLILRPQQIMGRYTGKNVLLQEKHDLITPSGTWKEKK